MALFLLCPNLGWIQGQFNFTELSLRYPNHLAYIDFRNGEMNREVGMKLAKEFEG